MEGRCSSDATRADRDPKSRPKTNKPPPRRDDIHPVTPDAVIVGAGAAGLTTAIFARRANPSMRVVVLDGAKKPGAKILVSGGSRCNVTNARVTGRDFWGGAPPAVRRVLRAFPVRETIAFFRDIGVTLHEEEDGKLFPDSNRSRDVLDALLGAAASAGVELRADHRVLAVDAAAGGFHLATSRGDFEARRVVLATGGLSLPRSGSDGAGLEIARRLGHTIVATTPALAPLVLSGNFHRSLSGVSHDAEIAIWVDGRVAIRLRGPLLWTHFGVSGPVALNASRHLLRAQLAGSTVAVTISCCPGRTFDAVDRALVDATRGRPRAALQTVISEFVPGAVGAALLAASGVDGSVTAAHAGRDDRRALARALVEWPLAVAGTRGYAVAEATAGGVSLDEIDPSTMESRAAPGLFLVGEMLDVDGRIGGFNFQWAWASGLVAGRALAKTFRQR